MKVEVPSDVRRFQPPFQDYGFRLKSDGKTAEVFNILRCETITPQRVGKKGRLKVLLSLKGIRKRRDLAPLILEVFHLKPSASHECSHLDGDPSNNNPENLCWETRGANLARYYRSKLESGTYRNGNAALEDDEVRWIRELNPKTTRSIKNLAEYYDVCDLTIKRIVHRETYRHVADELPSVATELGGDPFADDIATEDHPFFRP